MAVQFNEDSFTITVKTGCNPIEGWLELHKELLTILSAWDTETLIMPNPAHMLLLLENMMPEWETAIKMSE